METHVKVLGLVQIVLGLIGILLALFATVMFGGMAGFVAATGEEGSEIAVPILGLIGTFLVTFIVVLSIPVIIVGAGLLKFRPWARVPGIIMSILLIIHFPLGTIVGVYGLWVLLTGETEKLFAAKSAA